jgi:hypothetical protein
MRRILVLLAVVAVMVAVGALPAIAAPPSRLVSCYTDTGQVVAGFSTNEAVGFKYQGTFRADCISRGYVVTQEVEPDPGADYPYPPGRE